MVGGCKGDECMQWTSTTSMAGAQSDTIGGGSERARLRASEVRASERAELGATRQAAQAHRPAVPVLQVVAYPRGEGVMK